MGSELLWDKATRALAQSFSTWKQLTFGSTPFFIVGKEGCPVYCRIVSSVPGLPSLYASSIPLQLCQPQMSPELLKVFLEAKLSPTLKAPISGEETLLSTLHDYSGLGKAVHVLPKFLLRSESSRNIWLFYMVFRGYIKGDQCMAPRGNRSRIGSWSVL